jgi:alpha-glucoside transport system permease protein
MVTTRLVQTVVAVVALAVISGVYLKAGGRLISGMPTRLRGVAAATVWVGPAVLIVAIVLVGPALSTLRLSLFDGDGDEFVGAENYATAAGNDEILISLRNSVLWVVSLPVLSVAVGLAMAVLADRVRYESVVKSVLFLPVAISAVAAGVIWRFMLDYRPPGAPQTGTLNAIVTAIPGVTPVAWLVDRTTNNVALIGATLWTQAGFAMVILSAGLRSIPGELSEAARLDGASEWQLFRRIKLPLLAPTIVVVMTTMAVIALKAFDIVYVMTNGAYDTDVLATSMYKQLFSDRHQGRASAIATILMLAVTPIMVYNVRVYRREAVGR